MISATIGFLDSMFPRRSNNTGIRPSRTTQTATSASDAARKSQPITPSPKARELSNVSTLAVPDSVFHAENFMLGAGIVIIQPTTGKIVLVNEGKDWFLPKGRKDQGESLEQTALREGFEEVRLIFAFSVQYSSLIWASQSGYRADFLPLYVQTNAPPAPDAPRDKYKVIGEPLFTCINFYGGRKLRRPGEYLTFYYVGQIGPDAVSTLSQTEISRHNLITISPRYEKRTPGCGTKRSMSGIFLRSTKPGAISSFRAIMRGSILSIAPGTLGVKRLSWTRRSRGKNA